MSSLFKAVCLLISLLSYAVAESRPETQLEGRPGRGDILLEEFDSFSLRWKPILDFEQASLTITGKQGLVWERLFQAGEMLEYTLLDLEGIPLPDGSYTYEWRLTTLGLDDQETRVVAVQSGRFQIQAGTAESLVRTRSEEAFPLLTNALGNHFVGNLTTTGDLCVGCTDGEGADVVDNLGYPVLAAIRAKGSAPGIVLEQDDEAWWITNAGGDFGIDNILTGQEQYNGNYSFLIEDEAPRSIHIASSGKVGMGTATPTASLHIARSDGKARLLVKETAPSTEVRTMFELKNNGAPRFAFKNTNSQIEWSFQQSGPGNFLISKEGTGGPEMQVYQTGRVRMGPGGAANFDLDGVGNLKIKGSLTANGSTFPDYVFEPDYDLMPLPDLRSYIQTEKRLPDIPSAAEVKKQGGHNMTELQLKMLEKIEELTLYTLEQDQQLELRETEVESLKRDNAQMKAENAEIRARLAAIEAMLYAEWRRFE